MIAAPKQPLKVTRLDVQFRIATVEDDAGLRRLLRENPMAGDIQLSLEREPNYFAASAIEGSDTRTIVAIGENRVVCAGSISARLRYVNGKPMRIGYLGGLRLDRRCRNRISIIRRGYELFRQLHQEGGPPIYLTSVIADNTPARRLLERGLPGMPTYRFLGEFTTLVIRTYPTNSTASPPQMNAEIFELLNHHFPQFQLSPAWNVGDLTAIPGTVEIHQSREDDRTCAALWDQRELKQTVVRGYSGSLNRWRPLVNAAAKVLRSPRLPAIGEPISNAFVSHLCSDVSRPKMTVDLFRQLAGAAHARGISYLTAGFDSRDPRLDALVRTFRPRQYLSRLYTVHIDEEGARFADQLDDRLLAPEAALL